MNARNLACSVRQYVLKHPSRDTALGDKIFIYSLQRWKLKIDPLSFHIILGNNTAITSFVDTLIRLVENKIRHVKKQNEST